MGDGQAIVLTGTGANAAYEVGVMRALLLDRWGGAAPLDPICYCGTSAGALNAAIMVSRADQGATKAIADLEALWSEQIAVGSASSATGFFRVRAEPTQYLTMSSGIDLEAQVRPMLQMAADGFYFMRETARRLAFAMGSDGTIADRAVNMTELGQWIDVSPLVDLVNGAVQPADFKNAPKHAAITAVNWVTGRPCTFRNADLARQNGCDIILAAAAVPAVFPPRLINGRPYVDATVLMELPLGPAFDAIRNAKELEIHVVYVDASETDIPLPPLSNTFATAYRLFMLALSRQVNNDIDRARRMNGQLKMLHLFQSMLAGGTGSSEEQIKAAIRGKLGDDASEVWQELSAALHDRRLVTIHKHRPTKNVFGFDLGQFQRCTIEGLMANGYEDTMNHDCDRSGCVNA